MYIPLFLCEIFDVMLVGQLQRKGRKGNKELKFSLRVATTLILSSSLFFSERRRPTTSKE